MAKMDAMSALIKAGHFMAELVCDYPEGGKHTSWVVCGGGVSFCLECAVTEQQVIEAQKLDGFPLCAPGSPIVLRPKALSQAALAALGCECGAEKLNSSLHSHWCPKHT